MKFLIHFLLFASIMAAIFSCRQHTVSYEGKLEFSLDTLTFDTVFTTVGSATRLFKVYNPHNYRINISSIKLGDQPVSSFRMNVDGVSGKEFSDIEIAARDSLYVFVEVTVDQNTENLPFIIEDRIHFQTATDQQSVILNAYGQNAHFFENVLVCDLVWENDLPYVIRGALFVDTNCVLNIKEGVRIFMHHNSYMYVAGTLVIEGTQDTFVNFRGDRLERYFHGLPGQWGGIVFLRGSKNNEINFTRISEANTGVLIGMSTSDNLNDFTAANLPDVTIRNSIIKNTREDGVFSFFSNLTLENSLIHSIGKHNLALLFGGNHKIIHSTLANYGALGMEHKSPVLRLSNYAIQNQTEIHPRPVEALFANSIFYGNILMDTSATAGEIFMDEVEDSPFPFNYLFDHCLVRTNLDITGPSFQHTLKNKNPLFNDIQKDDYGLAPGSPAINSGNSLYAFPVDLYGNPRNTSQPDIGAIESE